MLTATPTRRAVARPPGEHGDEGEEAENAEEPPRQIRHEDPSSGYGLRLPQRPFLFQALACLFKE